MPFYVGRAVLTRRKESDNLWWDAFATEFFEDDATLTLTFCLEDGPKRYTIGRTLIPRYFRSIFEGGVTELYYNLKHPKESFHNTSITLDCDQCTMVTHHGKPMFTKVCTEGRLILEFTFDDLMRIKSWHFAVRTHRELVPRTVVAMHSQQDPGVLEQLAKNVTRQGITNSTLNYLRESTFQSNSCFNERYKNPQKNFLSGRFGSMYIHYSQAYKKVGVCILESKTKWNSGTNEWKGIRFMEARL
ncbi:hypothetical protein J437_LFUL016311 [Ladona fulva]|uniref:LIM domain-binding protein 2 n=1 Tax=Ladona fulva TaxID=123851 RepID=A0A8K0KJM3_LADFU|nr:hypothetical protein J437_LFUL016311 [Ladona fulva]